MENLVGKLFTEKAIFSNDYYSDIKQFTVNFENVLQNTLKIDTSKYNMYDTYLLNFDAYIAKMNQRGEYEITSILQLLCHPLRIGLNITSKTYNYFNIDIDFWHDVLLENEQHLKNGNPNLTMFLKDFTFKNEMLANFTLGRKEHGISFFYNRNYEWINVEFADGKKVKI